LRFPRCWARLPAGSPAKPGEPAATVRILYTKGKRHMNEQLFVTIAVGPMLSLIIVLAGYIVQNVNLNARIAEVRADLNITNTRFGELRTELKDVMQAEFRAIQALMEKNQIELLAKFAGLDTA
jgi:hypothetical protein